MRPSPRPLTFNSLRVESVSELVEMSRKQTLYLDFYSGVSQIKLLKQLHHICGRQIHPFINMFSISRH